MPFAIPEAQQPVMEEYAKHPRSSDHPDQVIVVTRSQGYLVTDQQKVFGPFSDSGYRQALVVERSGEWTTPEDTGLPYAITAKYLGQQAYCIDTWAGSCGVGQGNTIHILTFKKTGQITELTEEEYRAMRFYAQHSRYSHTPDD